MRQPESRLPGPEDYPDNPAADATNDLLGHAEEPADKRLSADALRLLGLDRVYDVLEGAEKERALRTPELRLAFDSIETSTYPRKLRIREKQGIASEVLAKGLLPEDVIKLHTTVYLGSGTDVEYPLVLGSRIILMVDPIFGSPKSVDEVSARIRRIIGEQPVRLGDRKFVFSFDFGSGREAVTVDLESQAVKTVGGEGVTKLDKGFNPPAEIGLLLMFAAQGPDGPIELSEHLTSRLTAKGIILADNRLLRCNEQTKKTELLTLGRIA